MRRIGTTVLLFMLCFFSTYAQDSLKKSPITIKRMVVVREKSELSTKTIENKPTEKTLIWSTEHIELGKIDKDVPVTASYELKNTSNKPMVLLEVKGSCGCTSIEFPEEAILPNETAEIIAVFDAKNIGPFKKSVRVTTNIHEDSFYLYFSGEVILRF